MSVLVWGIGAVVAGLVVVVVGAFQLGRRREGSPLERALPATPLQGLARRSLVVGGFLAAALVAVVLYFGPARTFEDDAVRIGFTVVLLGLLAVFGVVSGRVLSWVRRGGSVLDERDRGILSGAQALEAGAILTTLVVWVIGLQESYWSAGAVPVYYLGLVFWSCLVVSLLALPLGILLGYRRS